MLHSLGTFEVWIVQREGDGEPYAILRERGAGYGVAVSRVILGGDGITMQGIADFGSKASAEQAIEKREV